MRSDKRKTTEGTGGEGDGSPADRTTGGEVKSVADAWAAGRLKQAEKLLERFAKEFAECEAQDPNLLRDYYHWTGEPHYRTEYGWSPGRPEDNDEDPADVIERVNC